MDTGIDHSKAVTNFCIAGTGSSMVAKKLQKTAADMAAADPPGQAMEIQMAHATQVASTAVAAERNAIPLSLCNTRCPSAEVRRRRDVPVVSPAAISWRSAAQAR